MIIRYYNNSELAYSNRNRYITFLFEPFYTEKQCAVLLGDGANTEIKTNKNNVCNYVKIDDTRWFVTSYIYMNGGQVTLYLQRDVVGEFGLNECTGKIERGYTDSILKNRKELSLNEILKSRKHIIPNTLNYGNYSVNNHVNEMWGILYFTKPASGSITIPIPDFSPNFVNYPFISDGTVFKENINSSISQTMNIRVRADMTNIGAIHTKTASFQLIIKYEYDSNWYSTITVREISYNENSWDFYIRTMALGYPTSETLSEFVKEIGKQIAARSIANNDNSSIVLPIIPNIANNDVDYNGIIIKNNDTFYSYTSSQDTYDFLAFSFEGRITGYFDMLKGNQSIFSLPHSQGIAQFSVNDSKQNERFIPGINENALMNIIRYTSYVLTPEESGSIVLDGNQQLVDEPYSILVFPLYDTVISGSKNYTINKSTAFMVFNTVIEYLSGENPYLVDAQIFPYCPVLTKVGSEINGYPFFEILSNNYNHTVKTRLYPNSDVKKEYITKKYSIVSPEQSGNFSFNFYDYIVSQYNYNGVNLSELTTIVKVSLKPFSIISSCVITPEPNSLIGITYPSSLIGCQPTSNGFECSLASSAFETYKRQNSNYQQTFSLQKRELELSHQTERVNEITGSVVNTITATAMGAIGGKAVGGGIGAAVGGIGAAATVGIASGIQYNQNEKLRDFEKNLQQQSFDLQIGTIKNIPNTINRISSFNEILLQDFWYTIEIYECSDYEKLLVDEFIKSYGYGLGVIDFLLNYIKNGWFLRSTLIRSPLQPNLHNILYNEISGGIYYNE